MLEFKQKTDLTQLPQDIEFNSEELEAELIERLEVYNNLIVTEDSIKEAKADKAKLNKLISALEAKRKEVKKVCLTPYEGFELKIKKLVGLINAPILAIDTQVKTFEQKNKDEKFEKIQYHYTHNIGDLKDLVSLEKIIDPKWENATNSLRVICSNMAEKIEKIKFDLNTITDLKSEFELNIKDRYLQTFDISQALQEKTRLEERKAALELREQEQKQTQAAPIPTTPVQTAELIQEQSSVAVMEKPATRTVKFWAEGTEEQFQALRRFLIDNNIKFGAV